MSTPITVAPRRAMTREVQSVPVDRSRIRMFVLKAQNTLQVHLSR